MVAHFTMRTYGVNQAFRFDEDIWLHRKSRLYTTMVLILDGNPDHDVPV